MLREFVLLKLEVCFDAERDYFAVIQAKQTLQSRASQPRSCNEPRRHDAALPSGDLPEDAFAQRLLRHAPRVERSQRPDDVRNTGFTTNMRSGDRRVIEYRVNVGQTELVDV